MNKQANDSFEHDEHTERALQSLATTLSTMSGVNLFERVSQYLSTALDASFAFVAEYNDNRQKMKLVGGVGPDRFGQ